MFDKLSEVIEYYQDYHLTKHKYQYRAHNLRFFDVYTLRQLRRKHIKEYAQLRRLTVKNATINRELSFARAAINCVNFDYEIKLNNPFTKMKFVEEDYMANYLTKYEYQALLSAALKTNNHDLHDLIVLLTMTGCRPIELYTLTWDNVYLDKRQFVVRNYYSKSKRTMYKHLNDVALGTFKQRQQNKIGDHVFTNPATNDRYESLGKGFANACKRAGVIATMYDLRHTYASWLVQKGVSIYVVQGLMGHGDIASTMRYAHLANDNFVEAVQLII